ncbi:hypothetical protein [Agrococcus casei]|uniref:Uncharacterized protein n=1 Tax=Agrococcus casei LMG 22410 TaxID=1255656 RepID=A0A1R4EYV9_9MICO|nr:hypothetical protein [Agrococcus casei]SJM48834.1 hypothetical protein CZ674_01680 [Agrococcus casei LMG 22410]
MSDPLTGLALSVVFAAVGFYALYWVIRKAVAAGIRDAARDRGEGLNQ